MDSLTRIFCAIRDRQSRRHSPNTSTLAKARAPSRFALWVLCKRQRGFSAAQSASRINFRPARGAHGCSRGRKWLGRTIGEPLQYCLARLVAGLCNARNSWKMWFGFLRALRSSHPPRNKGGARERTHGWFETTTDMFTPLQAYNNGRRASPRVGKCLLRRDRHGRLFWF